MHTESVTDLPSLEQAIEHAAHLLPAQGPITVFIHHNTLHAFEDLPFAEAVKKGAQVFRCQPYLVEEKYRDALRRGRIRFSDLQEVLERDLGGDASNPVPCFGDRMQLRLAIMQFPLRGGPTEELVWYVAETNALRRVRQETSSATRARIIAETRHWVLRDLRGPSDGKSRPSLTASASFPRHLVELLDRIGESAIEQWTDEDWERFTLQALWRVCCEGVRHLPQFTSPPHITIRHRELLLDATGADADAPVNDVLVKFCAAFLDQGLAQWPLPDRDLGFFRAFCALYGLPGGPPEAWMRGLSAELRRLQTENVTPLESIAESLKVLGVENREWEEYLGATLLPLRGWAGMVQQVEQRGDRAARPVPQGSLIEFIAIRLILDRFSLAYTAKRALKFTGPLSELRRAVCPKVDKHWPPSVEQRAFLVFELAQIFGLAPDALYRLDSESWAAIFEEVEGFSGLERRRIFHLAYEQRFSTQTLDAVSLHAKSRKSRPKAPEFQVVCCIDEREESFRRHLEEIAPSVETFGAAGFFSVAMYYRGAAEAHYVPLCPVVIRPSHWVTEEVADEAGEIHRRRAKTRRAIGNASFRIHSGSRTFALGALLTASFGVLASIPLTGRILFPRLAARIRQMCGSFVRTPRMTRLQLERCEPKPGSENGSIGYSLAEMIDIGERLLRDIGLTSGFSRVVVVIGHGSNSLNNPHNSAYMCGACGGSAGGPNARAISEILNDPRVRAALAGRGLIIPVDTVFVGAYHNTCSDSVDFFDLDRLPASHCDDFAEARRNLDVTCDRNAHERCRRFMSAPLTLGFAEARTHVEGRSEDLAQTRPELGHATNAITIVGRREWSRGLFLDRRAFLTSYDPSQDDEENTILTRILQAVFPVCSGINLEYYFSNVDNVGFGCGTKLPHNLSALLGVMDGAASDLRTGLPWQMVEIHEPVRSLFIIETTVAAMTRIMDRNEGIGRLCRNEWIQLAVLDPQSREIFVFQGNQFRRYYEHTSVLPQTVSSVDWYRGWREHLEFAEIEAGDLVRAAH
jgi:uncharacterized protein YbcC (UPF0753/DUF2309 family)